MRCHRNASILCLCKSGLHFQITSCLVCEILLPVIGSLLISPGKEFTTAQTICGNLKQTIAGFIYICNKFRASIRDVKEIIYGLLYRSIIGNICAIHHRDLHFCHLISTGRECLYCRYNDPSFLIFRNCHVAPPIHWNNLFSFIHNTHSAVQKAAVFFQPEIHLISYFSDPFILIHTQDRLSVLIRCLGSIKRFCCKWSMSDNTNIPLYTTAEPRIAHCQIAKLKNIIGVKQISTCIFIPEFP